MAKKQTTQYTIRGVPSEVDQALRCKAHRRQISLNHLLVEELSLVAGPGPSEKFRSLKGLAGCWQEDPEFDRIITEQRKIDSELWQ